VDITAHGGKKARTAKERRCLVSRQTEAAEAMLRFVADPQGVVAADIKACLPGRGAWLLARRPVVEEAVRRRLFARALKAELRTPPDLAEQVDKLLRRAALANLSLARRSGAVITGAEKVKAALRSGRAALLLHAAEAAADSRRKLAQAARAAAAGRSDAAAGAGQKPEPVAILSPFTAEELRLAFGGQNVMHIAIVKDRGAAGFIKTVARLVAYRAESREQDTGIKQRAPGRAGAGAEPPAGQQKQAKADKRIAGNMAQAMIGKRNDR